MDTYDDPNLTRAELDAAIEAQREENLEFALIYLPVAAELWHALEW